MAQLPEIHIGALTVCLYFLRLVILLVNVFFCRIFGQPL
jgi:hypothetical protein